MKKFLVFLLAMLMLLMCFTSCGNTTSKVEKKLCSEKWIFVWDELQTETYVFHADGTYDLTIDSVLFSDVNEQNGTYSIEDDSIELTREDDSYTTSLTYEYKNGELTLTCRNKSLTK